MESHNWVKEFPNAVTVCDVNGIILEMNNASAKTFEESGGASLIGKNLFDCHPEPSRTRLKEMMSQRITNVYTIQKNGIKKLIYQSPLYKEGNYCGFIEISLVIPEAIPHFNRDA